MSLPRYAEYKNTGIASVGNVPAHWQVVRLKQMATIQNGRDYKDVEADTGGYPVFGSGGEFSRATDYLYDGESVLLGRKGTIDRPLYINGPFWTADTMFYTVINTDTSAKYLYYCALTIRFDLYSTNTALPSMTQADLGGIHFAAPSLAEQKTIVAFLDRETAKIDALISEQEKLITLLVEKRKATISHAVTKGLNPNTPMKDSGVEWLGEIPRHWDIRRIKDVTNLQSGHTPSRTVPEYWENCDIPWVSLNDSKQLAVTDYISDTAVYISSLGLENSSARMLPAGSVVFTRDATIGLAAITTKPMAVSQHLIAWCPIGKINALYLLRVFNMLKPHLDASTFGATIKTIGMADVKKLVTTVPPVEEQIEIEKFIENEISRLDILVVEARRATSLLKERRSALISAAVTGKIDVRPVVHQEQLTIQEAA